jgi:hypothetical protein
LAPVGDGYFSSKSEAIAYVDSDEYDSDECDSDDFKAIERIQYNCSLVGIKNKKAPYV